MGGQRNDTLIAGNGQSSMWGGSGNDLLISSQDDSNTIFFLAGDGHDTVEGFKALDANGQNTADTLDLYGQGITGVKLTQAGIKLYHDSDSLLLSGSYTANSKIQWQSGAAKGIAKIGKEAEKNNFTYDAEVTNYLGSKETDSLTLDNTNDAVSIWLDGSQGVTYDSVEIVDASRSNGDAILAGGEGRNTIIGGKGESSLWGGAGTANDTLNAGSGQSTFYYGQSEGNDVINNAKAIDTVTLYNLSLSDLKGATIENSRITLTQQNGQTLTVNGRAGEFTLADGSTWVADYNSKTWSRVK
jgi:Ca2+-binding RTX toxin-like protein